MTKKTLKNPKRLAAPKSAQHSGDPKIHPIIMYPFGHAASYEHLNALYDFLRKTTADNPAYTKPITVLNRQTFYNNAKFRFNRTANEAFIHFQKDVVATVSEIVDAWCVDTCQMWLAGLGRAYDKHHSAEDVYWLIPGDFYYASSAGAEVFKKLPEIPDAIRNHDQDLCLGAITVGVNSSKQLIDTYGTYGLLYNWFPREAQKIRLVTDKPRTEFFAISHSFLTEVLRQRWYAYEQTIVILLHAIFGKKRIHPVQLGNITDVPEGRDSLASAMQQVERTERVLKLFYRERYEPQADWIETFRKLDAQSAQIRGSALVILQNLLTQ